MTSVVLPAPFGPDEAENLAALQRDADFIDGDEAAETDGHAAGLKVHVERRPAADRHCSGGNFSTEKRPMQANLPLVACRMAIGRVVWMCSLDV